MRKFRIVSIAVVALLIAGCNQGGTDSEKIENAWKEAVSGNAKYVVTVDPKEAEKSIKADGFNEWTTGICTTNELTAKKDKHKCTMKIGKIGKSWAKVDEFCEGGLGGGISEWTYFMKKEGSDWKAPVFEEK